jgi:hypothetical protein
MKHKYSIEKLYHFNCVSCNLWWTVSDIHIIRKHKELSCPFCGHRSLTEQIPIGDKDVCINID